MKNENQNEEKQRPANHRFSSIAGFRASMTV